MLQNMMSLTFGRRDDFSGFYRCGYLAGGPLSGAKGRGLLGISGSAWFESAQLSAGSRGTGGGASASGAAADDFRHGPGRNAVNEILESAGTERRIRSAPASGYCGIHSLHNIVQNLPAGLLQSPAMVWTAMRKAITTDELRGIFYDVSLQKASTTSHLDAMELGPLLARIFGQGVVIRAESHFSAKVSEQRLQLTMALYKMDEETDMAVTVDLEEEKIAPTTLLAGELPTIIVYTSVVHQTKRMSNGELAEPVVGHGFHIEAIVHPQTPGLHYVNNIFTDAPCWPVDTWIALSAAMEPDEEDDEF